MKVMEAIGRGFGIANKNIGLLVIIFVFNLVWNLASLPFLGNMQGQTPLNLNPAVFLLSLVFILINIFIQGGAFGLLKEAISSDGKAVLGNFAKYGKKFFLKFLTMGLIILAGIGLAVLVIGFLFSISAVVKNIIVNIVSVTVGVIVTAVALYYLFLLFLSPYVLVVDDVGIFKAMGNSMRFVRGNLLRVAGLSTLLILIGLGIGFIVGILAGMLSFVLKGTPFQVATGVLTSLVNSYITILISAALLVYYSAVSGAGQGKEPEVLSA